MASGGGVVVALVGRYSVMVVLVEATFYPPRSAFNGTPSIFRNATRGPLRYERCNNLKKTLDTISGCVSKSPVLLDS